jgi:hypothetical protein
VTETASWNGLGTLGACVIARSSPNSKSSQRGSPQPDVGATISADFAGGIWVD